MIKSRFNSKYLDVQKVKGDCCSGWINIIIQTTAANANAAFMMQDLPFAYVIVGTMPEHFKSAFSLVLFAIKVNIENICASSIYISIYCKYQCLPTLIFENYLSIIPLSNIVDYLTDDVEYITHVKLNK